MAGKNWLNVAPETHLHFTQYGRTILKVVFCVFFFTEIRYRKVIPTAFTKMDYKNKTRDREIILKWKKEWRSIDRWKRIVLIESLEYSIT